MLCQMILAENGAKTAYLPSWSLWQGGSSTDGPFSCRASGSNRLCLLAKGQLPAKAARIAPGGLLRIGLLGGAAQGPDPPLGLSSHPVPGFCPTAPTAFRPTA